MKVKELQSVLLEEILTEEVKVVIENQIKETALSQISKEMTKPIKKVKNPKGKVLDSLLM